MKLIQENDRIVAVCSYEQREIPKRVGFRWDPTRHHWWTNSDEVASKLSSYAEGDLRGRLELISARREDAIKRSRAIDAEIDVPAPEGKTYFGYQKAGVAFASSRWKTLLADDMGLGKTIEAIGVINASDDIAHVLIVCPATIRLNWKNELESWLTHKLLCVIANGSWPNAADIIIVNYELLKKHHDAVRKIEWDLLILDESQFVKNEKAQRTCEVIGRAGQPERTKNGKKYPAVTPITPIRAKREIWMTGTPLLNRPIELWTTVNRLAPEVFPNYWHFARRYCNAYQSRYGWDVSGASHLDELQEKLRGSIMIRRLKRDVLKELLPKRRQVIEIPANGAASVVRAEQEAWTKHEDLLFNLHVTSELAKASEDSQDYDNAVKALKEAAEVAFVEMSAARHETALAKAPAVIEYAKEILGDVELPPGSVTHRKLIIFAHHLDVIEKLHAGLWEYGVVKLTGEMSAEAKEKSVRRFQNDLSVRVFVGSIRAAGLGITLTAADHEVFAELDWTPAIMTQAEDRAHRIGQAESLLVQHLVLEGSLDANMAKQLIAKQDVIDRVLDDDPPPEPTLPIEAAASATATQKAIAEDAATLTPEDVQEIHHQLRRLSGVCDGALALDGYGFNKLDQRIGHQLAALAQLTPKQAALGKKILVKYRKQLGERKEGE